MAEFNAKQQLPGLLDWMRAQMKACGGKTAVIGISGGKDSSVTAALSVAAYGRENVVGVLMPDGVQPDIDYSNGLVDVLNIRHYTFNIHGGTSGILDEMARVGIDASRQTKVNLPSRIRMATLYAIAQSEEGGIVINTSNLSEDWVGYCTIYGDSAGAFSPLGMYTTEEVIALGAELGLPERFLIKPPSDGLTGKTDEDNLGFTYHAVNEYIRKGEVDPAIKEQIDRKHKVSRFKFQTIPVYQNGCRSSCRRRRIIIILTKSKQRAALHLSPCVPQGCEQRGPFSHVIEWPLTLAAAPSAALPLRASRG